MTDVPFDRLFWKDALKRVAQKTRNKADAEDLLHTAFVRMTNYGKSHVINNPAAFLVQTATNIQIDNYRHQKLVSDCLSDGALETQNNIAAQDEVMITRARLARAHAGLEQLPPRTRDIFLLHRLEGLKYREIAEHFGISQSSVEKHIAKAFVFLSDWTKGW